MPISTITPRELLDLHRRGEPVELIDVRTPEEYRTVRVEFARNEPLDALDPARVLASRTAPAGRPLYFICHAGIRSQQACEKFQAAGFANVVNVEGGTAGWYNEGLPVVAG